MHIDSTLPSSSVYLKVFEVWPSERRQKIEAHLRDSGIGNEEIIQHVLDMPLEEFRP
jgi:hypothetical protein